MFAKAKALYHGSDSQHSGGDAEEGESLTTILRTPEDRIALTVLLSDITEAMRQAIEDTFDAKETGTETDLIIDSNTDIKGATPAEPARPSEEEAEALEKQQEQQRRELVQREKELGEQAMQELKKAAVDHWDEWRSSVLQRVGEVLNSREEQEKRQDQPQPDQQPSAAPAASPPIKFSEPLRYDPTVDVTMKKLYPPIENEIRKLPREQRALILHSLLLLLLSLEHYKAESRVLLVRLSTSLDLPVDVLGLDEGKVARALLAAAENMSADAETKKKQDDGQFGRKWKVGLATVGGALLIGVTGGLAAPLIAAGIGSVMGGLGLAGTAAAGYLGALAGSSVLVGGIFGAYGGKMTGEAMDAYAKEVEDFAFEPVRTHHKPRKIEKEFRRLRVAIGISGWLTDQDEVVKPWRVIGAQLETFALRWELEALMNLGNSLAAIMTSAAWTLAKREIISRTMFATLFAGLSWPLALLRVSRIIDNPFSVANHRAHKAGEVLAEALIDKAQGERPVTLVGYSLGAKVIFVCLKRLAERKAFGLVENCVLIGAPAPSTAADWRMIRTVVSGRCVNVFSVNDYILGFLYRSHNIAMGIAGLQAVENVKGVENVDVSSLVDGHLKYRFLTGQILRQIGFEDLDLDEVAVEEKALKDHEKKTEAERSEHEQDITNAESDGVSDEYVGQLATRVEKKNEQSYVGWAQSRMVAAGTNVSTAYEKAKAQWLYRKDGDKEQATTNAPGLASHAGPEPSQHDADTQFERSTESALALPTRPKAT